MSDIPIPKSRRPVPWRGRRRVPNRKDIAISFRCTAKDHAVIKDVARRAGLSTGAFLRAIALGSPGPRAIKRPPAGQEELVRILGLLGNLTSNVNQLAHGFNRTGRLAGLPELIAI